MEVVEREKRSCYQLQTTNLIRYIENYNDNKIWRHQIDAVLQIKAYFENPRNKIGICVLPTGSGKSGISTMSPYACAARRVLVITPSKHISKQMFDNFCDEKGQSFFVKRGLSTTNMAFLNGVRPICRGVIEKTNDIHLYLMTN
jgi:superfamily II DNA or RNA helicase